MISKPLPVHGSTGSVVDETVKLIIYLVTHFLRFHRSHPVLLMPVLVVGSLNRIIGPVHVPESVLLLLSKMVLPVLLVLPLLSHLLQ